MSLSRRALFFGRWSAPERPSVAPGGGVVHWLEPRARKEPEHALPMVARLLPFNCLNQLGGFCSTCVERCPEPGAVRLDGRRPVVDADRCTGCGVCAERCPAPGGALVMVPVVR